MEVDILAVRDERVQARVIDDVEADIRRCEASDLEDRIGPLPQGFLDLGIADQALRRCRDGNGDGGHGRCSKSQEVSRHVRRLL